MAINFLYCESKYWFEIQILFHQSGIQCRQSGPRLNIKTVFPRYGDSHVKDKTVMRPSYLLHGDPYTGKMTYLYPNGPHASL